MTLGLCSQRELDAVVARAAKAAGIEAPQHDSRLAGDREALIEELRQERDAAVRDADAAHAAEVAADQEVAPADRDFVDPFKQ